MMKLRLAAPTVLIDIGRLAELAGISADGDELVIGAMTRHADLAASGLVRAEAPLLAHAAAQVGDPQIRHRGTHRRLARARRPGRRPADGAACARRIGRGRRARRDARGSRPTISSPGFFETAWRRTSCSPRCGCRAAPGAAWGYQKFVRRANDWAIVGVAAAGGRIALANMGPVPLRASAAEQALAGGASAADAAELAADGTEPGEDIHADGEYRRHLARVLTRRALEQRT